MTNVNYEHLKENPEELKEEGPFGKDLGGQQVIIQFRDTEDQ